MPDATAITFLGPTTIAIAGWLILHEPLQLRQVIAGCKGLSHPLYHLELTNCSIYRSVRTRWSSLDCSPKGDIRLGIDV
jgi:hypothetical protein